MVRASKKKADKDGKSEAHVAHSSGGGRHGKNQVCHQFLRGHCKFGESCKFSHSKKLIGSLQRAFAAASKLSVPDDDGRGATPQGGVASVPGASCSPTTAGAPPSATCAVYGASVISTTGPSATQGRASPSTPTPWVRAPDRPLVGPLSIGSLGPAQYVKGSQIGQHANPSNAESHFRGPLRSLKDIPKDAWELIDPPATGYNYRSWIHFVEGSLMAVDTL